MIVSNFIQSNQLLLRHPSYFKRARICKPAMAFVTDRVIDTDAFSQQNGGTVPGHILQDRETIDTASER